MLKKPTLRFLSLGNVINTCLFILITWVLTGCGEAHRFEDFTFDGSGKTEAIFSQNSKACEEEKGKFSNKIQGREFGFKGQDVGYFGCMKLKGWEKKEPGLH